MSEKRPTDPPLLAGALIDFRFEIEQRVGSGGMGTVFRAQDRHRGATVALKLLTRTIRSPLEMERFVREATILSELRHPGIVSYVAHGISAEGWPFLAMDWLDGEDLAHRLERGWLSITECLALLDHTAAALDAAHRHHIIHRDLKPSNLFLRNGQIEQLRLIDFGIARRAFSSRPLTRTGAVIGTPEYMAPEQARGESNLLPSADIFALGCVLYECVAGIPPFAGDRLLEILAKLLYEEPLLPRILRPEVPPAFEDLLLRMLAKDPAQRPIDAKAVLSAVGTLRGAQEARGGGKQNASAPPRVVAEESKQVLCIVAAAFHDAAEPAPTTLNSEELAPSELQGSALKDILPSRDAEALQLADGTLVVILASGGELVDQAARAAGCALSIKDRWPSAQVVVTVGTGMFGHTLPAGEVLGRTLRLLAQADGVIELDRQSAELLADRFVVHEAASRLTLQAQRSVWDWATPPYPESLPLVGRQLELDLLKTWLAGRLEQESTGTALVIAPAGAGKSRLVREFLRWVAADGIALSVCNGRETMAALQRSEYRGRLQEQCARQPVLLVFDDLQSLDEPLVQQLAAVLRELAEFPLFALGVGRPETSGRFTRLLGERIQEFPLRPLKVQSSEYLVRRALGSLATPQQVRQISHRAAGNPRRLSLLLRAAQQNEEPPAAFLLDLQAQILRLPPAASRLLRAASLCGDVFSEQAVLSLLDGEQAQSYLKQSLDELQADGILCPLPALTREPGLAEDAQYKFADSLFREAAFRLLTSHDSRLGL